MPKSILFRYWGKAKPDYPAEPKWHPLVYHCLDVAAVVACWWDSDRALRARFGLAFDCMDGKLEKLRAWILFFVALHDLGKFDVRFQLKAPDALVAAWGHLEKKQDHDIASGEIQHFDHGRAGMVWGYRELSDWLGLDAESARERWINWLAAVTGHHGDFYEPGGWGSIDAIEADDRIIKHDQEARHAFISALAALFLTPVGLRLQDLPPVCSLPARALLAGFCAVCDWIGSNTAEFEYRLPDQDLPNYFDQRTQQVQDRRLLDRLGLRGDFCGYAGLDALLGEGEFPRGVQTEIDALPVVPGLMLIEAPTGSGKTEAALAYAWRLLEAGAADGIIFALPTQATANAMLLRLEAFAECVFGRANIILAHGKRQLNKAFQQLVERGQRPTVQGVEDASVQCAAWLANSRKLVFLGQVGVCTIDQVLLSVLPVRHKFMRGFGINKSVLIVDEVHAYDAYMHGLLGEVLKNQKACGGSAILLSATLPADLRQKLLGTWGAQGLDSAPYPVLWHTTGGEVELKGVADEQCPEKKKVDTECLKLADARPDAALLKRIVTAAESGALVGIVVNLVDDAQWLARELRERTSIGVDVFHARYQFADRQDKEAAVQRNYGRHAPRKTGRILVATQVVEQSLDLDFDWLLTQICPVDLLFQRIGRLHRHRRVQRPPGFAAPCCTVMTVQGEDFGLFKLIYGNARVLWRTQRLLEQDGPLVFPTAYRSWIEQVYQREDWDDEPDEIAVAYDLFHSLQLGREKDAQRLTTMTVSSFRDEDDRITRLTRDGEMSLSVLPLMADRFLLDGQRIEEISKCGLAEEINLNVVPCPASWKNHLRDCRTETDGLFAGLLQLVMAKSAPGAWQSVNGKYTYSCDFGLEKRHDEPA